MPCPLLIFSQSDHLIRIVATNSHTYWQTVQIQISWLLQKPTDLDLHCLERQGNSRFSKTRVNIFELLHFSHSHKKGFSLLANTEDITKTHLFKYIENFTSKNWKFSDKNSDIFHISAQNLDCGYSLELPRWGSSNEYPHSMFWAEIRKIMYPCKPQLYYIKVGFKGVKII